MDSFSEDFKTWMDGKGFTSETLAPVIGKSPGTIANWRSRGVPERSSVRDFLTAFMADYQRPAPQPEETRIAIPFTDDEYELVEKAARLSELGTPAFVRIAATERAQDEIAKRSHLKVADGGQDSIPMPDQNPVSYPPGKRNGSKWGDEWLALAGA